MCISYPSVDGALEKPSTRESVRRVTVTHEWYLPGDWSVRVDFGLFREEESSSLVSASDFAR